MSRRRTGGWFSKKQNPPLAALAFPLDQPHAVTHPPIRTRGSNDFVFLDLHIWMDRDMRLDEAHRLSHVVKDRLMARFPQIKDAIIHIEPPPRAGSDHE